MTFYVDDNLKFDDNQNLVRKITQNKLFIMSNLIEK